MAMDPQTIWIYTEYLQTSRDYVLHLQQLGVLLITALAIVFYNNAKVIKVSSNLCAAGTQVT